MSENGDEILELAENGDADAQVFLGRKYEKLNDYEQALFWYKKAAMQGYADGQYHLGEMYYHGYSVEKDDDRAFFWYMRAARQGHPESEYRVGVIYCDENEKAADQDYSKALYWFTQAENHGHSEARSMMTLTQSDLGDQAYSSMEYVEAFQHYSRAAEYGHSWAQYMMGYMYHYSIGVDADYARAMNLYLKSAVRGWRLPQAQYELGNMYYNGEGVSKDNQKAYMWYYFSFLTLSKVENEQRKAQVEERLNSIEGLNESQIEEAKAEALRKFNVQP